MYLLTESETTFHCKVNMSPTTRSYIETIGSLHAYWSTYPATPHDWLEYVQRYVSNYTTWFTRICTEVCIQLHHMADSNSYRAIYPTTPHDWLLHFNTWSTIYDPLLHHVQCSWLMVSTKWTPDFLKGPWKTCMSAVVPYYTQLYRPFTGPLQRHRKSWQGEQKLQGLPQRPLCGVPEQLWWVGLTNLVMFTRWEPTRFSHPIILD